MKTNRFVEPPSKNQNPGDSKYPYNNITQTESGHTIELDDTPGKERVRIHHGISESFIEMHPDGDIVIKSEKDEYEITVRDKNVLVKGQLNITVLGDAVFDITGDKIEYVKGNYKQVIDGNYEQVVGGETSITSKSDMYISANPSLGGVLSLGGGSLTFPSDLNVDGELTARKITSKTRVDAGEGMMAGPAGFVTHLGGIAVGTGVAIPLCITSAGFISSMSFVAAPLGTFGVMCAGLMTDFINTTLYDVHTHPSFRGPTGPPFPPMI
jgi:hypothetical protein